MSRISDKTAINNPTLDRRYKITPEHRAEIKRLYYVEGVHIRGIAKIFPQISRRSIQFIIFPERLEKVKARAIELKRWKKYNQKEYHTPAMRKHRQHKKELWDKGLIGDKKEQK